MKKIKGYIYIIHGAAIRAEFKLYENKSNAINAAAATVRDRLQKQCPLKFDYEKCVVDLTNKDSHLLLDERKHSIYATIIATIYEED